MVMHIACIGIAVLDCTYTMPALPDSPGKYIAAGYAEVGGGMAATASVAVARLGGRATWIGRSGDDATGATLRAGLAAHGVAHCPALVAQRGATPSSAVLIDPKGERILAVFPGAGLVEEPRFDLADARAVLSDPRWVAGAEHGFALARAAGLPCVLDADISAPSILHRLAPQADHVVFSQKGLSEFAGTPDPAAGLATAAARLSATLAVTLGEQGSLWWRDGAAHPLPAPRVAARNTTGCGDVFHGAYTLAIAEGAPVEAAARFATAAAALKAEAGSGWDAVPDRAAVSALLARGW